MSRRGWMDDVARATTRGRCAFYIGSAEVGIETLRLCKRTGTLSLTVGNLLPEGPFCWQHALIVQDRATAQAIDTGATVRLEEVQG